MTHTADIKRIHQMMALPVPEDAAQELRTLDNIRASLEESGIIEGFDPFDYTDISEEPEDADAYGNQNIPEGK